MQDQVTLVNEQDEVIGALDKIEAHRGEGKLHRAISVFLFRKNSQSGEVELLVQQRSDKKIVGAVQWANAVCGNVWPGESYEECALRRLKFELGIESDAGEKGVGEQVLEIQPVHKFQYHVQCNEEFSENEIDQVFAGWFDGSMKLNPDEVRETAWVSWKALENPLSREQLEKSWVPWFEIMMSNQDIINEINELYVK